MPQAQAQCFAPGWIYAGETFDFSWRRLAGPGSHAVAAEMLSPLTRVSGSKVQYSTTGGYDCYFPFVEGDLPRQAIGECSSGVLPQLHPVIRARNAEHDRNSHDCDRERPARTNSDEVCNQNGHADENGLPEGPSQIEYRGKENDSCLDLVLPVDHDMPFFVARTRDKRAVLCRAWTGRSLGQT
jgi:hypothetical protein